MNFEIIYYWTPLKEHIDRVVETSKKTLLKCQNDGKIAGNYGRGSFVTFLSHDITTRIIQIIRDFIQESIAEEVKLAGMFSVEMDTTQDVTTQDQCSIVLRYVHDGHVSERLLSLVKSTSGTGASLFSLLKNTLTKYGLDIANCVGDSFDGAANMSGIYNGVAAKIASVASLHVHTWCYSHSLNLVLTDATSSTTAATTLFGVVQRASTFFKNAYKRMGVWDKTLEERGRRFRRLVSIGETRWLSKSAALIKIFESYSATDSTKSGLLVESILALNAIAEEPTFQESARSDAKFLLEHFMKFETLLTAHVFLLIYKITTPLSLYLQTKGLDMLQAWRMVETVSKEIATISRDFESVHQKAKEFCASVNLTLDELGTDLEMDVALPKKRARKKKRMAGEQCQDEAVMNEVESYRINVFNAIMDRVTQNLNERFLNHEKIYKDFACFDPRRFNELKQAGIPSSATSKVCELLGDRVNRELLRTQLESFVGSYQRLAMSLPEEFEILANGEESEDDGDEEKNDVSTCKENSKTCKACFTCAYKVLHQYSLNSTAYSELYTVYHFLLTLAITQVECERSFSKLKLIKTKLRSTMSQENLDSVMLISVESDILNRVSLAKVVDKLASTSKELKRLLTI